MPSPYVSFLTRILRIQGIFLCIEGRLKRRRKPMIVVILAIKQVKSGWELELENLRKLTAAVFPAIDFPRFRPTHYSQCG